MFMRQSSTLITGCISSTMLMLSPGVYTDSIVSSCIVIAKMSANVASFSHPLSPASIPSCLISNIFLQKTGLFLDADWLVGYYIYM